MKKLSWILELSPNSPKDFGNAIKKIAIQSFGLAGKHQIASTLEQNLNINSQSIRIWLTGTLDDKRKPFTLQHFRTFIAYFWRRGEIGLEEIIALSRCAGEDYFFDTKRSWLKELTGIDLSVTKYPPARDDRYPLPTTILPRENILEQISTKIIPALQNKQPIVIYGAPGMGKTTQIQYLEKEWERSATLQHHFPDGMKTIILEAENLTLYYVSGLKAYMEA